MTAAPGGSQAAWSTFQDDQASRAARHDALVGVEDHLVAVVLEAAQGGPLGVVGIAQERASASSAWVAMTTASNRSACPLVVRTVTPVLVA